MHISQAQPGDIIYANKDILNDGSMPETKINEVLAKEGTRGVLVNTGHFEEFPETTLYLVRFENEAKELGLEVTCLEDEIVVNDAS
jgi:nitrogen fixation protein NifZ